MVLKWKTRKLLISLIGNDWPPCKGCANSSVLWISITDGFPTSLTSHGCYMTSSRRTNPGNGPMTSRALLNSSNGKLVRLPFSYTPIQIDSSKWKPMLQTTHMEPSCLKNKWMINITQLVSCWNRWTPPNTTTEYLIRRLLQSWRDFRIGDTGLNEWNSQPRSSLTTRILNISQNLVFSIDDRCAGWSCWHTTTMKFTTDLVTRTVLPTLSWHAELKPPDGEDNQPLCLIPKTKFSEIATCEAELTDSDWQDLTDIILTALTISDTDILSETQRISQDWQDKPEGLEWEDGLGWKDGWIWIPEEDGIWKKVMRLYHDSLVTGHLGMTGMTELVSCSYWHCNLPDYMKWYMQGCHTCRWVKHQNQHELGKLQLIPTPNGPWQWIQSDFMGELPKLDGFNAIYVVSDWLTKMVHFIPTTTDISAPDLMKLHVHHIWKLHGIPLIHGTNCGSTFTANFMKNIYKELRIEPWFSTMYHPQTQGQVENNNKWMEMYLRMFCSHWQDDWVDLLLTAEFAYNNHHPLIDMTPFSVNYGYHLTLMNVPSAGQSGETDEQIWQIHETQEECKCAIEQSQEISKWVYNKWKNKNPGFKVRDSVWLEATNLSTDEPSPKLASKWHSPFKIKDKLSDLTYCLELPHAGESMMFSMWIFCWKQSLTWFPNVGSQCHLLLRSMTRIFGLWRSTWMPDVPELIPIQDTMGWIFRRAQYLGRCRWHWFWWWTPSPGRGWWQFWFRRGLLSQTPWCSKENGSSCCSETASQMPEGMPLVHGDMDCW